MPTIDFHLPCATCNADLIGLPLSADCPECGEPVAGTFDPDIIDRDTHTLIRDVVCTSCGYNLRGLLAADRCPECAATIAQSLRPMHLRFADPRWLRDVHQSVVVLLICTIATVPLLAILLTMMGTRYVVVAYVLLSLHALLALASAIGIAKPDPRACVIGKALRSHNIAALLFVEVAFGFALIMLLVDLRRTAPPVLTAMLFGLLILDCLMACVSMANVVICLRCIAVRLRRPTLIRRATKVLCFLLGTLAAFALYLICVMYSWQFAVVPLLCLVLPLALTVWLEAIILLVGLHRAFRENAEGRRP